MKKNRKSQPECGFPLFTPTDKDSPEQVFMF